MPSRYYKIVLPVLVLVLAGGVAVFAGYRSLHTQPIAGASPEASSSALVDSGADTALVPTGTIATTSEKTPSRPVPISQSAWDAQYGSTTASTTASSTATEQDTVSATFIVGSNHYTLALPPNSTVDAAMAQLAASDHSFTFTQQEYPGIGEFIESINGKAATSDMNWMLYVNGAQAQTGASETVVHPGDVIEWRYES